MTDTHVQVGNAKSVWAAWVALGTFGFAASMALALASHRFGPAVPPNDRPALLLAAGLVLVGAVSVLLLPLVAKTLDHGLGGDRRLLGLMIIFGAAMRLSLCWSTPVFEDDWNRYLWDGAVTAGGYNPYAVSPDDAQDDAHAGSLQALAHRSGIVIERINHSHLKTIYPPVAQAAFALAHAIEPWSLAAWRGVLMTAEVATLALLLALLSAAGRSPLWAALYWWSPLVAKEIVNSAHMEGIVTPMVLATLLLSVRRRPMAATTVLGLAIGAKLWPVMLAPLVFRPLLDQPRRLALAILLLLTLMTLWSWPIVVGGLDASSGFIAFAKDWRTNSALFPAIERGAQAVLGGFDLDPKLPGLVVRTMLAGVVGGLALAVARRPIADAADLMRRAAVVTAALFLLSPAQFPWYAIWMLPFLCFRPSFALLALTALVPIYYAAFHFLARDSHEVFRSTVVWLIWLPVWALLAVEAMGAFTARRHAFRGSGAGHA
ncbi:MAG: glycosyltransferase 87 family protein [Hyphomicrobium sp.]